VNDIVDRAEDAKHPCKRHRPIASGRSRSARRASPPSRSRLGAFAIAWFLPTEVRVTRFALRPGPVVARRYLGLNVAYNPGSSASRSPTSRASRSAS
jgi:4-hydroxybenzoate polyprenyltransferase